MSPPERELVEIVAEESDRLQNLVTDAVHMLRIESSGFIFHRERHSLAALGSSLIGELSARLDGHAVTNSVPLDVTVDADGELLRRALRQLLDNAAKNSPAGSTRGAS